MYEASALRQQCPGSARSHLHDSVLLFFDFFFSPSLAGADVFAAFAGALEAVAVEAGALEAGAFEATDLGGMLAMGKSTKVERVAVMAMSSAHRWL